MCSAMPAAGGTASWQSRRPPAVRMRNENERLKRKLIVRGLGRLFAGCGLRAPVQRDQFGGDDLGRPPPLALAVLPRAVGEPAGDEDQPPLPEVLAGELGELPPADDLMP